MEKPKDKKTTVPEGLSATEVFASQESVHRLLDRVEGSSAKDLWSSGGHSNFIKLIAAANLLLITFVVLYLAVTRNTGIILPPAQAIAQTPPHSDQPAATAAEPATPAEETPEIGDPAAALSHANELYNKGQYGLALVAYAKLPRQLAAGQQDSKLLTTCIQFRSAICQQKLGNLTAAMTLFNATVSGPSPLIRAYSSYNAGLVELQKSRFMAARIRLYTCLGVAGGLRDDLRQTLERECSFLLARAVVSQFLETVDRKIELPEAMWNRPPLGDPTANLTGDDLTALIAAGKDFYPPVPVVKQSPEQPPANPTRWTVAAKSAPVYDLLRELGAKASFNMRWEAPDAQKTKTVSVRLTEASPDNAAEVIAGSAGLMTCLKNGVPTVISPESILAPEQQKRIYAAEAISLLNRFIVLYTKDDSVAAAYYAMATVHEQTGAAMVAIADYKVLVSRYSISPLTPFALWNSSRLKLSVGDSAGARADLAQLVELNPDHVMHSNALLKLAELMMADGIYKDADHIFRKVYSMNPSPEYVTAAALGAAKCLYEMKNYVEASEWFIRYIQLEKNKKSPELYVAAMSLGKCQRQLARLPQSVEAFKFAMARELTPEQQTKTAIELARTEIAAQSYVKALTALHKLPVTPNLTDDEIDVLLLTAQINCEIGMPEKAAIALQNAIDRAFNKERAAPLALPLAGALVQMGESSKAAEVLNKILAGIPHSATANEIQCQLAAINLELGRNPEVIVLCTALIAQKPSDELIDKAFRIMGKAYANMKQYDKAALAFAGKVSADGGAGI